MKRVLNRLLFFVLVLLAPATAVAAAPEGTSPGCRYVEAGRPGPAGNVLAIDRNVDGVGVRREGDDIVVFSPFHDSDSLLDCEGPVATVDSIDRVVYRPPGGGDPPRIDHQLSIDLGGGQLQPGATSEPGGDEIEIVADFPREPPNKWSSIFVRGGAAEDRMRIGGLRGGRTGVSLNLRLDGRYPDADLIVSAATDAHFQLNGGDGDDRLGGTGAGVEFQGPIRQGTLAFRGGGGDDTIYGGPQRDNVDGGDHADTIYGGENRDRLDGGAGGDRVLGGAGEDQLQAGFDEAEIFHDFLSGGANRDSLQARDGNRDAVRCGAGPDHAYIDGIDEWSRATCEKQHGPDFPR